MKNVRETSHAIFASVDHFVIKFCANQLLKDIESISIKNRAKNFAGILYIN
jgi:hypothetical protein